MFVVIRGCVLHQAIGNLYTVGDDVFCRDTENINKLKELHDRGLFAEALA
jgi:hypothetical protein